MPEKLASIGSSSCCQIQNFRIPTAQLIFKHDAERKHKPTNKFNPAKNMNYH